MAFSSSSRSVLKPCACASADRRRHAGAAGRAPRCRRPCPNASNKACALEVGSDAGRPRPRKEPPEKVRPVARHLDQRLVHQVLQHVLAPDVDDERHPGLDGGDIGEVLIRPYADVGPGLVDLLQFRDDVLKRRLVGDQVVGPKKPPGSEKPTTIDQKSLSLTAVGQRLRGDVGPGLNQTPSVASAAKAAINSRRRRIIGRSSGTRPGSGYKCTRCRPLVKLRSSCPRRFSGHLQTALH